MTKSKFRNVQLFVFLICVGLGCSGQHDGGDDLQAKLQVHPLLPNIRGEALRGSSLRDGSQKSITLSNGAEVMVQNRNGTLFYLVEGTFTRDGFAQVMTRLMDKSVDERKAYISHEIEEIFKQLKTIDAIPSDQYPEVGYFTFEVPYQTDLMAPLKTLKFNHEVTLNPVIFHPQGMENPAEGLSSLGSPRVYNLSTEDSAAKANKKSPLVLNGLDRMHVEEFLRQAESDIGSGVKVDGGTVLAGITDTGLTLNHPGLQGRVVYLRDSTRQGRVYFNPDAKFEASVPVGAPEDTLLINAEVILTPPLPRVPTGDGLKQYPPLRARVSSELKARLTDPQQKAYLGVLNDPSFSSLFEEPSQEGGGDGNQDEVTGGKFLLIFFPGGANGSDVLYVDPTGTGDFRHSQALGDWNRTQKSLRIYSERIGFDFRDEALPSKDKSRRISVKSVSIIGFDPESHGTHVAGIIGGAANAVDQPFTAIHSGVAPGVKLLSNRVCAAGGGCNPTLGFLDLALNGNAQVINMSLGALSPFNDGYGVQETLINRLTSLADVLFFVSAGNSGPGRQTVGMPSTARYAVSVGATANRDMIQAQYQWPANGVSPNASSAAEDFMLFFSSRGPTAAGGFKPNLVAPGSALSSVTLNSPPGEHGGLDVYWGTSMAAPSATGAYALFLDAIQKYNLAHADQPLSTTALILREVLIQSARPFDVSRYNPETGEHLEGQYTWIDQGTGMIDLLAAWKKLFEVRDHSVQTALNDPFAALFKQASTSIDLDYEVLVSMTNPTGLAYDGSDAGLPGVPAFGTGIYLDFRGTNTLTQVQVIRALPERYGITPFAGELMAQLRTTSDEFVLKTTYYGSDQAWLKVGTRSQLDCMDSPVSNLTVTGEGASVGVYGNGSGYLNPFYMSTLNVCINRDKIAHDLQAGDHGALISAYRVVDGKEAPLPSFTVPVYITVPHQKMNQSLSYEVEGTVESFGVKRNYVYFPPGTTFARVTLEVPLIKKGSDDLPLAGQSCSGVELMALEGGNTLEPFQSRAEAQVFNCDGTGSIDENHIRQSVSFTTYDPKPGIWDLLIFGSYKYPFSYYKLKVDYLLADTSVKSIQGGLKALSGQFHFTLKETSLELSPESSQSEYSLEGLSAVTQSRVKNGDFVVVPNPEADLRTYPEGIKKVKISLGDSPGNDIDLYIFECSKPTSEKKPVRNHEGPLLLQGNRGSALPECINVAASTGPSDTEEVTFEPQPDRVYLVRVDGVSVKNAGRFSSEETLFFKKEKGDLEISKLAHQNQSGSSFQVDYALNQDQTQKSLVLKNELFLSGKYDLVGSLSLRSQDRSLLAEVPVKITQDMELASAGDVNVLEKSGVTLASDFSKNETENASPLLQGRFDILPQAK